MVTSSCNDHSNPEPSQPYQLALTRSLTEELPALSDGQPRPLIFREGKNVPVAPPDAVHLKTRAQVTLIRTVLYTKYRPSSEVNRGTQRRKNGLGQVPVVKLIQIRSFAA